MAKGSRNFCPNGTGITDSIPPHSFHPFRPKPFWFTLMLPRPPSSELGTIPSSFHSFSFPTSAPSATLTPTLSTSILSGNYQPHYTLNAQIAATQVSLDVQIVSAVTFGSTAITESGTLTVSQTVQQSGSLISQIVASVIPFSQTVPKDSDGPHYFGLDKGDGALGFTASGLLNSQTSWTQISWTDSAAFLTNGSWSFSDNSTLGLSSQEQSSQAYTSSTTTQADGIQISTAKTSATLQSQFTLFYLPANIPTILLTENPFLPPILPSVLGPVANTHVMFQRKWHKLAKS